MLEHFARHGVEPVVGMLGTHHIKQFRNWNKAKRYFGGSGKRDGEERIETTRKTRESYDECA
jgi:hypothetical protein